MTCSSPSIDIPANPCNKGTNCAFGTGSAEFMTVCLDRTSSLFEFMEL